MAMPHKADENIGMPPSGIHANGGAEDVQKMGDCFGAGLHKTSNSDVHADHVLTNW